MRRAWSIIVAIILFGLMLWNLLQGENLTGGAVPGAALVLIAFTLTWWFEETGRAR